MNRYSLFLLAIVIIVNSCKEEKERFKPSTLVSCKVNGEDWKTDDGVIYMSRWEDSGPKTGYIRYNYETEIIALRTNGTDTSILVFYLNNKTELTGEYTLDYNEDTEAYAILYPSLEEYENEDNQRYYESGSSGSIKITKFNPITKAIDADFHIDLKPSPAFSSYPSYNITNGKISNMKHYPDY